MALATYFLSGPAVRAPEGDDTLGEDTTLGFPFPSPYGIMLIANRKERNAFCQKP